MEPPRRLVTQTPVSHSWGAVQCSLKGLPPKQPLRFGRPPGWRARTDRDIDLVLRECHHLALDALEEVASKPDTS
jgi:hypothetical protein